MPVLSISSAIFILAGLVMAAPLLQFNDDGAWRSLNCLFGVNSARSRGSYRAKSSVAQLHRVGWNRRGIRLKQARPYRQQARPEYAGHQPPFGETQGIIEPPLDCVKQPLNP